MLLSLPSELLLASLTYLSLEDLVKLRVVCKKLYSLCFFFIFVEAFYHLQQQHIDKFDN